MSLYLYKDMLFWIIKVIYLTMTHLLTNIMYFRNTTPCTFTYRQQRMMELAVFLLDLLESLQHLFQLVEYGLVLGNQRWKVAAGVVAVVVVVEPPHLVRVVVPRNYQGVNRVARGRAVLAPQGRTIQIVVEN